MLTYQGINFYEMHNGSGRLQLGSDSGTAYRRIRCNWADSVPLLLAMRGWVRLQNDTYTAKAPATHPSNLGLYVVDGTINPAGRPLGENTWEYADIDLTYKNLVFNPLGQGDMLDESLDFSAEMVDLGKDSWQFGEEADDSNPTADRTIQKLVPMISYCVTQYHVITLRTSIIYDLLGKLNLKVFRGAAPFHMLYAGCSAQRKSVGTINNITYLDWTIQHKFMYANRDLNTEWRTSTGAFEKIISASGTFKFDSGDFGTLGIGTAAMGAS